MYPPKLTQNSPDVTTSRRAVPLSVRRISCRGGAGHYQRLLRLSGTVLPEEAHCASAAQCCPKRQCGDKGRHRRDVPGRCHETA